MTKNIFLAGTLCLFLILIALEAWSEQPMLLDVGIVRVSEAMAPALCYTLLRKGKSIRPFLRDMPVFNGDVIIPFEGKRVTLIYRHTNCKEMVITQRTTVTCDPRTFDTPGGFLNLLPEVMQETITRSKQNSQVPSEGDTHEKEADMSCFPDDFRFSPWPPTGTTVLHQSPILFRWFPLDKRILSCANAALIIVRIENKEKIATPMKIGELIQISIPFQAGASYNWHVEMDGKRVSNTYRFSIVEKNASDNIRSQIAEVAKKYKDRCPGLRQALYLQIISDSTPGLNLFSDSFRLMREHKRCVNKMN